MKMVVEAGLEYDLELSEGLLLEMRQAELEVSESLLPEESSEVAGLTVG
jgi:hypothetical protein